MEYINEKLNEFNDYIRFRKVAIVGLGVSNLPLMEYLYEKKANVTVFDERDIDSISKDIMDKITTYGFGFHFGEDALKNLPEVCPININDFTFSIIGFASGV